MPISNRDNEVIGKTNVEPQWLHIVLTYFCIGVLKLNDKLNGMPFNENEQEILQVFSTFCGLGIHNVINYEKILKANAKQMVALEVIIIIISMYTINDVVSLTGSLLSCKCLQRRRYETNGMLI